jgi:hypothetical protein
MLHRQFGAASKRHSAGECSATSLHGENGIPFNHLKGLMTAPLWEFYGCLPPSGRDAPLAQRATQKTPL